LTIWPARRFARAGLGADRIVKAIGPLTLLTIGKVMGLLLCALAVQLMILGLADLGLIDRTRAVH